LELTLLKFLLIGIGGAFLGLLSAALGVLLRNALAAAGAASGICVLMQIPLYILPSLEYKWMFDPIYRKIPWDAVRTLAITPVRIFFNSEYLTRMWYMESQMNNTNFFNMMLDPQSFTLFFLPIFVSMALCVWICTMYKRLS